MITSPHTPRTAGNNLGTEGMNQVAEALKINKALKLLNLEGSSLVAAVCSRGVLIEACDE